MNDTAQTPPPPPVPPTPSAPPTPTGPIRSTISTGYRLRLGLMGLGLAGFGCWALYDGLVNYPQQNVIYAEFEEFKETHDDWQTSWAAHAEPLGYETNYNKLKKRGQTKDIYAQYLYAGLTLPFGLWFLGGFAKSFGRWVEADERGVRNHKGVDVAWDQVTGMDDQRWKSKGIAYLRYEDGGSEGRVLLDDWKFDRETTDTIYKLAKGKISTPDPDTA